MLDRAKCEKMFVWDDYNNKKRKRIVIYTNNNGSCVAVAYAEEDAFLRGEDFQTVSWDYCEPIPEKKFRPMTNAEMRGFIANTSGIEFHFHLWNKDRWEVNNIFSALSDAKLWTYRTISQTGEVGEPQEFVVEVEE